VLKVGVSRNESNTGCSSATQRHNIEDLGIGQRADTTIEEEKAVERTECGSGRSGRTDWRQWGFGVPCRRLIAITEQGGETVETRVSDVDATFAKSRQEDVGGKA
jgi:hypothetical protein